MMLVSFSGSSKQEWNRSFRTMWNQIISCSPSHLYFSVTTLWSRSTCVMIKSLYTLHQAALAFGARWGTLHPQCRYWGENKRPQEKGCPCHTFLWQKPMKFNLGVSKNRDTPKSSILIGFSHINNPFWGAPIFGNTHIQIWPNSPVFWHPDREFCNIDDLVECSFVFPHRIHGTGMDWFCFNINIYIYLDLPKGAKWF